MIICSSTFLWAEPKDTQLSDEEIKEILLSQVDELFTGDDGKECFVEIEELTRIAEKNGDLLVHYQGLRDETEHGCGPYVLHCATKLQSTSTKSWKTESLCLQ